jgi:hypothetical protein
MISLLNCVAYCKGRVRPPFTAFDSRLSFGLTFGVREGDRSYSLEFFLGAFTSFQSSVFQNTIASLDPACDTTGAKTRFDLRHSFAVCFIRYG